MSYLGGGTVYDRNDPSTCWTHTGQFTCWIKNNIERKSKFLNLQKDAENVNSLSDKVKERALFCAYLCSIILNVKGHFDKHRQGADSVWEEQMPNPVPDYILSGEILPAASFGHKGKTHAKVSTHTHT